VPELGFVFGFMQRLWAVGHGLQATSKRMNATLGVTGPQRLVVRILGRVPGASAGHLASLLRIHPSTLTGVLRRLEARGILERRRDPNDARRAHLSLTARGRALDVPSRGTVEAAVQRVLSAASPRQIKAASELLAALAAALDRRRDAAPGPDRPRPDRRRRRGGGHG
jgi:DNA-binding MarR family transcriptional regulator